MKKLLSFLLAAIFCFNISVNTTYALSSTSYLSGLNSFVETAKSELSIGTTDELIAFIENDIESLSQYNINKEYIEKVDFNGTNLIYEINNPHIDEKVYLETYYKNGNRVLIFTEGEKTDTLTYTNDGKILLNGNEVIMLRTSNLSDSIVTPRGMVYYNSANPVYGYARDYNTANSTFAQNNSSYSAGVSFRDLIMNLTISAISAIIFSAFPLESFSNVSVNLMANAIRDYATANAPGETNCYYDDIIHEHDFNSTALYRYYEHNIYYYFKPLGVSGPYINSTPYNYYSANIVN